MSDLEVLSIDDLERVARDRMDKMTREYYNSGADGEITQVSYFPLLIKLQIAG